MPHPAGFAGNDFLPLISAQGDAASEAFAGPMRPTRLLSPERPYLHDVLASIGAVLGRTRLMRLSGHAEVSEHVDVNYYWRDRMRVHVPIITQPVVRFHCGGEMVHMAPGECWVFDTWSLHRVVNHQTRWRVHLVIDTVGGEAMLDLLVNGRSPSAPQPAGWVPRLIAPSGAVPKLLFETANVPAVMSPWEMREHINFLLAETAPRQPLTAEIARLSSPFMHKWRALWSAFGEAEEGWPHFRLLLNQFARDLAAMRADRLMLQNELDFLEAFKGLVLSVAVADKSANANAGEQRIAPQARTAVEDARV
jgi:hypothetical protein